MKQKYLVFKKLKLKKCNIWKLYIKKEKVEREIFQILIRNNRDLLLTFDLFTF